MSAAPLSASPRRLCGWGRTSYSTAAVITPRSADEVCEAVGAASERGDLGNRGLIARGAGRSYGDAAQNEGGAVIDATELREVEVGDGMLVRAGAGATLGQLIGRLALEGLALPVVPGTRHVTVGGAIAADIHGKNHRRDGSFGHHVKSLLLCTPDGRLRDVSRDREADLFHATLGGMGLTGVIVEATMRVAPLRGPTLESDIDRTQTIEQALAVMEQGEAHRYCIAWVDLLSGGSAFGRSVVLRCNDRPLAGDWGEEIAGSSLGRSRAATTGSSQGSFRLPGRPRLTVPEAAPGWLLSPPLVRAFNVQHWRRSPRCARGRSISIGENLFPLDSLGHWNRLYRNGGLVQYQFAVPDERRDLLVEVVQRLRAARQPMYLAVIKRFGDGSGGLLSFPMRGWTFAIDLPAASPGLPQALDDADRLVADGGGRVYLAKDARMRDEMMGEMYPQLRRFEEIRASVDPQGLLRSDLARRLGLCGEGERKGDGRLENELGRPGGGERIARRESVG